LHTEVKTLVVSASPRDDGNSHVLAQSAIDGARSAGHDVRHVFLDDYVQRMLGNCRRCRRIEDSSCSLDDRYEELLIDHILLADGVIFAMPLYFYGMPARLKTVFDRLFCYTANSSPMQDQVVSEIMDKRIGVLILRGELRRRDAGRHRPVPGTHAIPAPGLGRRRCRQCQQPRRDRA
jgi:multimeric flavodoxin WrbA